LQLAAIVSPVVALLILFRVLERPSLARPRPPVLPFSPACSFLGLPAHQLLPLVVKLGLPFDLVHLDSAVSHSVSAQVV
jgi:hypothetical protein